MPNPRSLPIAIDPSSFNMIASMATAMPTAATQLGGRMAPALLQEVAASLGRHSGRPTDNLPDPTGTSCPRSSCTERASPADA